MHRIEVSAQLAKTMKKLYKKDRTRYEALKKKMVEIDGSENPDHYKNLSGDMKEYRRVHIDSHFVLIFKIEEDVIRFETLRHHDEIY
jgi:YafQ family addiction module toxin component